MDSISWGSVNECDPDCHDVTGDLGNSAETNRPHKESQTFFFFWHCADSLTSSTRRPSPELSVALNSHSLCAFCACLPNAGRGAIFMMIGKLGYLAVNLVTDKLRCCPGHQCFFHYLSGFMLHLDLLFISEPVHPSNTAVYLLMACYIIYFTGWNFMFRLSSGWLQD